MLTGWGKHGKGGGGDGPFSQAMDGRPVDAEQISGAGIVDQDGQHPRQAIFGASHGVAPCSI